MGALGAMSSSFISFLDMLKDLNFDERAHSFIVKRIINIQLVQNSTSFVVGIRQAQTQN